MRSLHPADAVHKGFGTIPTSILQRKNGVCIYERPACYNGVGSEKLTHRRSRDFASQQAIPALSYIFPKFFDRRYSSGERQNCFLNTAANFP